ncbi:hypothetical protein F1654_12810 [Alkalicaulis satelles]|uniref:ZIP family metal transporter n=1 Tax=Alkalicaulis satelles TaxID=2609175 RepID=A0A5M6Z8I0_9PROT|nr:hypothetical protein [Alkalicaulis satelles]KAA5800942.1 hypothetical protein F1654_12810 [Alkalicaulis satelles]
MGPVGSALIFAALMAGAVALALVMALSAAGFTRRHAPLFAAFAGGLIVTLAVVEMIPAAFAQSAYGPWLVLAGFAGGFLLQGLTGGSAGAAAAKAGTGRGRAAALAAVAALAIHSALDGVVFAVAHAVDPALAAGAAVGLILHQAPVAVVCFLLLQRAGLSDRMAALTGFAAAGLTASIASISAAPFAATLDMAVLGVLMALVAGLLLHVGAAHLLSEAFASGVVRGGGAVFAGAGAGALMLMAHVHDHDHAHGDAAHAAPHHHHGHHFGHPRTHDHEHGHDHDHADGARHNHAHDHDHDDRRGHHQLGHDRHGHDHRHHPEEEPSP